MQSVFSVESRFILSDLSIHRSFSLEPSEFCTNPDLLLLDICGLCLLFLLVTVLLDFTNNVFLISILL